MMKPTKEELRAMSDAARDSMNNLVPCVANAAHLLTLLVAYAEATAPKKKRGGCLSCCGGFKSDTQYKCRRNAGHAGNHKCGLAKWTDAEGRMRP